jgi:hypothetical protein
MPFWGTKILVKICLLCVLLFGSLLVPTTAAAVGQVSLAPKQEKKLKHFKKLKMQSRNAVRWYDNKGKWTRHTRFKKCSQVPWPARRPICYKARRLYRAHEQRFQNMSLRIERILFLRWPIGNVSHWECIHSGWKNGRKVGNGEGDWEDGGNTYWGGLQMDIDFMESHGLDLLRKYGYPRGHVGPNGWKNAWTPREQMVVAERAKRGIRTSLVNSRVVFWNDRPRGYGPWPNTSIVCGLR